tara:strand:- start:3184 stop:4014 length:831 start_codon:yes stop_codon:yes gene_type:complete
MQNYKNFIFSLNQLAIVCHRGLWGTLPENSISSIQKAIDQNLPIVEIDVRQNLNGEFYLIHDETLNRTTNLLGNIRNVSSEDLKNCKLKEGDGYTKKVTDEQIPSLQNVLDKFSGKIFFDIDNKDIQERDDLIKFIHDNHYCSYVDVKKSLKNIDEANYFIEKEKHFNLINMIILNLEENQINDSLEILQITKPDIVEINFKDLNSFIKVSNFANKLGVRVWVNTLDGVTIDDFNDTFALSNPDNSWGVLIKNGTSIIQTDKPLDLLDWYNNQYIS